MSSKTTIMAIVSTVVIGAAAAGATTFWSSQNTYAIKVNGEVVSLDTFNKVLTNAKKQKEGQIGMDFNSEKGKKELVKMKKDIVKGLTEATLFKQEAKKMNLSVKPEEVTKQIDDLIKQRFKGSKESFEAELKKNRTTLPELKQQVEDRALMKKLYEEIIKEVKVSDADIKSYFEKNKAQFKVPEQIEAQHILIKPEETKAITDEKDEKKKEALKKVEDQKASAKAKSLVQQLQGGADFAKLAKEHSSDPGSKDNGGKYTFPKGQMVPEFEKAAWDAKPGELIIEPVKTQFGYHIIKRGKSLPATMKTLKEVKPQIEQILNKEKVGKHVTEWMAKRKKAAHVELNSSFDMSAKDVLAPEPPPPAVPAGAPAGHGHDH